MILYDGTSDIYWFYDGLKTRADMDGDAHYPHGGRAVLMDNGNGKVYDWLLLDVMCDTYGVSKTEDAQADFDAVVEAMNTPRPTLEEQVASAEAKAEQALEGSNPQLTALARMQVATMDLTADTDDTVAGINTLLPDFVPDGHEYKTGDSFAYDGRTWRVAQAHTSQPQWKPGDTGTESLYYEVVIAPDGILVWRQPTGAHDAPGMGVKRHYPDADGPIYVSKREGNTSVPGTDEWWDKE